MRSISTPFIEHNRDHGGISITCVDKLHTQTGMCAVELDDVFPNEEITISASI